MSELGNRIITNYLRDYYKVSHGLGPDKIEQREFGFGNFETKVAFRHMTFKNNEELSKYLINTAPPFVDYSAAYYRHPDARPMERKEWLGSELRFDIDSNDIPTPCKLDHGKEWVCEKCLEASKQEVVKLIENFLISDFGLSDKEIEINFSGNRGYHLHARNESVLLLAASAREEISNYISGQELDVNTFFSSDYTENARGRLIGPKPNDGGWRGKVANSFIDAISSKESLIALGIDKRTASWLFRNMTHVKEQIALGNWDFFRIPKREEVFGNLLHGLAVKQGNKIDRGVTRDPSHLMRLPNTIHGGSGLIAKKISSLTSLEKFNPLQETIAFRNGELKVRANSKYKLIMNGQEFGPYRNEIVTLPAYAAIYLYLKGAADMLIGS
jgi:DNA primase small subunit